MLVMLEHVDELEPTGRSTARSAVLEVNVAVLDVQRTEVSELLEIRCDKEEHVLLQLSETDSLQSLKQTAQSVIV